jgi:hypothetical protein
VKLVSIWCIIVSIIVTHDQSGLLEARLDDAVLVLLRQGAVCMYRINRRRMSYAVMCRLV